MISRRVLFHLGHRWSPTWELRLFRGLDSWLLGFRWERHDHEWHAELHFGPVMLHLEHVDHQGPRLRDGMDWFEIRWWDFARTRGGYEHSLFGHVDGTVRPRRDDEIVSPSIAVPGSVEWVPWSDWRPPQPSAWELLPTIPVDRGAVRYIKPPPVD